MPTPLDRPGREPDDSADGVCRRCEARAVRRPERAPARRRNVVAGRRSVHGPRRRWLYLALAGAALPAASASQEPPPTVFGESVDVTVREVEVYVTDEHGQPVTDLQADDFQLLEDGKRVKITNFAAIHRTPSPAGEAGNVTEPGTQAATAGAAPPPPPVESQDRLYFVIYLDEVHIQPRNRDRVFAQLDDFLAARQADDDRVMVVRYNRSLTVEQRFTGRADEVRSTLERLRDRATSGVQTEALWWSTIEDMKRIGEVVCQPPNGGPSDPCACSKDTMIARAQQYAAAAFAEVDGSLRALGEVVNSLAGLIGRKAILYVSDGLELRSGDALFTMIEEWCPLGSSAGNPADAFPATASAHAGNGVSALNTLEKLTAHAGRNGVTLYTIQAAGLGAYAQARVDGDYSAPNLRTRQVNNMLIDQVRRENLQQPLNAIAADTGGLAFFGSNDFAAALARIDQDATFYYSLGYEPNRKFDGRNHSIDVQVKRPGVRVRHRTKQRDMSFWEQAANRTVSALWHQIDYNPGKIVVAFGAGSEVDRASRRLPVVLRVGLDAMQLVFDGESYVGRLSIFVVAQGESGSAPPPRRVRVPIRVKPDDYVLAYDNQVEFPLTLTVSPGANHLAFGVWDEVSLRYSVLYREVTLE